MENKFMRVEEVAEVLEVSTSFAYKVIRQLNDELKAKGFITIAGRINREYFYERLYQMKWVARMNNIRSRATEIVNHDIIYN